MSDPASPKVSLVDQWMDGRKTNFRTADRSPKIIIQNQPSPKLVDKTAQVVPSPSEIQNISQNSASQDGKSAVIK